MRKRTSHLGEGYSTKISIDLRMRVAGDVLHGAMSHDFATEEIRVQIAECCVAVGEDVVCDEVGDICARRRGSHVELFAGQVSCDLQRVKQWVIRELMVLQGTT